MSKNDLETIGLTLELIETKNVGEVDTTSFDIGIDNLVGLYEEVPVQSQQTKQNWKQHRNPLQLLTMRETQHTLPNGL